MIRIIFLGFLFFCSLFANKLETTYDVYFGILPLGYAHTFLESEQDNYYIRMEVYTTGIAKVLSNNRTEIYESRGKVVNDLLVPDIFIKKRITNSYTKVKKYTFDHKNKVVWKESSKQKTGGKAEYHKEKFQYYAVNDILSLYFNIIKVVKRSQKDYFVFYAVGGKTDDNGRIDINRLSKEEFKLLKDVLDVNDKNDMILKVIINQDIFSSENGVLLLKIDMNRDICIKAVLENVLLFGDIVGEAR
jgi:hypothetical protein